MQISAEGSSKKYVLGKFGTSLSPFHWLAKHKEEEEEDVNSAFMDMDDAGWRQRSSERGYLRQNVPERPRSTSNKTARAVQRHGSLLLRK